ncbi:MAG: UDP-N-acetylmuramate--L-alanine ligase [Phycisphaerales bacterium]|nr:UDP-N-acetylmuramate--L-alanine ligase [Phycisphaerales bacterium]
MPSAQRSLAPAPAQSVPLEVSGRKVYLIGIGGCGMAGLARMLRARAGLVEGSDAYPGEATEALERDGIPVGHDQSRAWLPDACDLVITSAAIKPDHPQVLEARRRGMPVLTYAEALGRCMVGRTGVALAGTHGKSTTTAMLGAVLVDAGLDPTVIVGATCGQLAGGTAKPGAPVGFRLGGATIPRGTLAGEPGLLLAEACEFNRSFHNYQPAVASISSVEADHLDIYGSLDAVVEAFRQFALRVAPADRGGRLLIAHRGAHRQEVTAGVTARVETIGLDPEADWTIGIDPSEQRVTLRRSGDHTAAWTMRIPGAHNAINSATAAALAIILGADPGIVEASLSAFAGVDRRMQNLGRLPLPRGGWVKVYDDYGHHPTEVESTLRALRQFERPEDQGGRLICVFQPHQHSRTRHLLDEFAASFGSADIVIVPHIYFVRDSIAEKQSVSSADLVDRLRARGVRAMHLYPFEAIVEHLDTLVRDGDVVAVMGAGPVWQVARGYIERLVGRAARPPVMVDSGRSRSLAVG